MRHNVDGRKFGRNTSHRKAMFKNMANAVIEKEQVVTTVQKAKEVKRVVDRLITLGKNQSLHSRRLAFDRTRNDAVVAKLFGVLAERYKNRAGGYTRVLKMSDRRWGDAAEMAVIELVDHPVIDRKKKPSKKEANSEANTDDTSTQAPKDPWGRFRKMFSKGSEGKSGKAGGSKKGSAAPRTSARKAPVSGSNKSG